MQRQDRRSTSTGRSCDFVESRASALAGRDDARIALDELLREPAAAIFARAHAGPKPSEEQALFRTVLVSLLISTAEACGGFDWDDRAFERAYAEFEGRCSAHARLCGGRAARRALGRHPGRARRRDPHASRGHRRACPSLAGGPGLLPQSSAARSTAIACSSSSGSLERVKSRPTRPRSSPTPFGDRLATAAPSPPVPCCSNGSTGGRRDRPVLPIRQRSRRASHQARFLPRRGHTRGARAARACRRDAPLAEALDRWELRSSRRNRSAPNSCAAPSPACSANLGAPRRGPARRRQ